MTDGAMKVSMNVDLNRGSNWHDKLASLGGEVKLPSGCL